MMITFPLYKAIAAVGLWNWAQGAASKYQSTVSPTTARVNVLTSRSRWASRWTRL
jgi:hypothetical protein